jgi:hypothetical protein
MRRDSISQGVPSIGTRTEPGISSGVNPGSNPVEMRDAVYRAMQLALESFEHKDEAGNVTTGPAALAEAMGAARSDTYLRVARKEDGKGSLCRAFIDFLGPLLAHGAARRAFVDSLMAALDYEAPVPRRRVTDEEMGRATLAWVRALPSSMRDAALADIAASLGIRAESLK